MAESGLPVASNPAVTTFLAGRFTVSVDGVQVGMFSEVSGLSVEMKFETYEEGGNNGFVHKLRGRLEWPHLVLKRGVTNTDTLFRWIYLGMPSFPTAAVQLVSEDGKPLRTWSIMRALPVRWTGPSFAASADDVAREELEIAHHGFRAS